MILHPEWTWDTIPDEYVEDVIHAREICSPDGCNNCPLRRDFNGAQACLCWLPGADEKDKLLDRFNNLVYDDLSEDVQEKLIKLLTKN